MIHSKVLPLAFISLLLSTFTISCTSNSTSSNDEIVYGTVTGNDGYEYKTVKIGNQEWMAEDVGTHTYQDGGSIPSLTFVEDEKIKEGWRTSNEYTFLYNWYAINESGGICPEDWILPSNNDWNTLINHLGDNAGGKLKLDNDSWRSPNKGATNSTGFSAWPGGAIFVRDVGYSNIGSAAYYWTSTEIGNDKAIVRYLVYEEKGVSKMDGLKFTGASVRCIKD